MASRFTTPHKIVVLGDGGVGKTALTIQLCLQHFIETVSLTFPNSSSRHDHAVAVSAGSLTLCSSSTLASIQPTCEAYVVSGTLRNLACAPSWIPLIRCLCHSTTPQSKTRTGSKLS